MADPLDLAGGAIVGLAGFGDAIGLAVEGRVLMMTLVLPSRGGSGRPRWLVRLHRANWYKFGRVVL